MPLIVAHPDCMPRFGGQGLRWVYADEQLSVYESIAESLGEGFRLVSAREFQHAASELQPEFIEWTDAHINHSDVADALLTPLHRNPFGNNLLLHLTWLTLIAARGDTVTDLLVFTESAALARTIRDICHERNWAFRQVGRLRMMAVWSKARFRACTKLGYEGITALIRMALSRATLGPTHIARCRDADILVDTYFYTDSLQADGIFRDKHLPGLVDWYRSQSRKPAVYPFFIHIPLKNLLAVYARMRDSATLFVPWERFVGPGQVVASVLRCLAYGTGSQPGALAFRNVAVARLVASLRFQAATAGLYPMLLARAPQRLHAYGVRPKYFLDWFENQPLDKANAIGFSALQSGCRVVGLRQYALYPNFANLYTTDREVAAGTCPPETWVSGRALIDMLRRHDHCSKFRVVPALRYAGLYSMHQSSGRRNDLLIVLTHSGEESMAILTMAFPVLERAAALFAAVRIKAHPDFPVANFIDSLERRWPWIRSASWIHWESRSMDQLLGDTRLAITAGTSAALEALCRGVPVIMIGRQAGLDINPLTKADERLWTTVYDCSELERAICNWSPAHPVAHAELMAISTIIRGEYFEEVSHHTLQSFSL